MALIRLIPPPHYPKVHYHAFNRFAGGQFLFSSQVEKDKFLEFAREYALFCGITLITHCIMDNHFHLHLEVPRKPDTLPSDEKLLELLGALSTKQAKRDARDLVKYRQEANHEAAEALRQALFSRMWNLSKYMKLLQERYSQWLNRRLGRKGTVWQGPYGCEMSDGSGPTLVHQAAYIDLNTLRAQMVGDPAEYIWSGYGQAMAGNELALRGLSIAVGAYLRVAPETLSKEDILDNYRVLLYVKGEIKGYDEEGRPLRPGFSREECVKVFEQGGKLTSQEFLRLKVRYMTAGLVMGSKQFVEAVFEANRHRFGSRRKTGARKVRGLKDCELYTLRDLRRKVVS